MKEGILHAQPCDPDASDPPRPPVSEYALRVWTMVARHGMTPTLAARRLEISTWRVERIVVGVSRRNANRW